jgi:hypothetical protein
MYPQLEYYYRNREKILNKNREIAIKNSKFNEKYGVAKKSKGGGRPLTVNPINLMEQYEKLNVKKENYNKNTLEVKKGNYLIKFN